MPRIRVEVIYAASPARQTLIGLEVAAGTTVAQAVELSGIKAEHPDIEILNTRVGIFGRPVALNAVLEEGDRVEIYRPLHADPKEARRRKVRRRR
jgi:putative ubiquitin-RnfH superfamily antitoxin RatB of RatAB toxin-antitoxin module